MTTVRSTNSFFATHPGPLEAATVARMGRLTVDSYPEGTTTDPAAAAAARANELLAVEGAWGVPVVIGEMGYSNDLPVDDATQAAVLHAEFGALAGLPFLAGVNYWVGAGTNNSGGYTHLYSGGTGAWGLRPAAAELDAFYAAYGVGIPPPPATATPSPTLTAAPSGTATASPTSTGTAALPSPTGTGTATATATGTATATPTNTPRAVPSATVTVSSTATATARPSSTATASSTRTPGATGTQTATRTLTPTAQPSDTRTSLPPTSTPSATSGRTVTFTATRTPTPTQTPASSPTPSPTAPAGGCPAAWRCTDVGGPALAGGQGVAAGAWTVYGSGRDIWGAADQFHFLWQPLGAAAGIAVQVRSQTPSNSWAKAGPMLRQDLSPGAAHYAAFVTPGHGVLVQYRPSQDAQAVHLTLAPLTTPVYLKIACGAAGCSAFSSPDGRAWAPIPGSTLRLSLGSGALAGLAVTSHTTAGISTVASTPPILE